MRPDQVPVTLAWFRPALALVSLVAFLVLGTLAVKRFRGQRPESSKAGASGSEPRQDPDRRERARVHVAITDPRHRRRRLDDPAVPADNNGTERDIRSLAAARNDGGTHRADWSAAAFARLKSVIVTAMKNQVRFIRYGIEVVRARLRGERLPLPLAATPDTS